MTERRTGKSIHKPKNISEIPPEILEQREKAWQESVGYNAERIEAAKAAGAPLPEEFPIYTSGGKLIVSHQNFLLEGEEGIAREIRRLNKRGRTGSSADQERTIYLADAIKAGKTDEQIAAEMGKTTPEVKSLLHRERTKGADVPLRGVDPNKLLTMFKQGVDESNAAKEFKVQIHTIRAWKKYFITEGQLPRETDSYSERNVLIVDLWRQGYMAEEIAIEVSARFPTITTTDRAVEGVVGVKIKNGELQRHRRGRKK